MTKLLVTMVLLFVSLNGYANCSANKPEEMSYYAYMDEEELQYEYCFCNEKAKMQKRIGDNSMEDNQNVAAMYYAQEKIAREEMIKITRVLKKDYEAEPLCKE